MGATLVDAGDAGGGQHNPLRQITVSIESTAPQQGLDGSLEPLRTPSTPCATVAILIHMGNAGGRGH